MRYAGKACSLRGRVGNYIKNRMVLKTGLTCLLRGTILWSGLLLNNYGLLL